MKQLIAANDNNPLGRVFSFDEAAAHLRVSKRAFQDIIKRHPFYAKNGRVYLFSESDVLKIWEAMRCPSNSNAARDPNIGISVAPSEASLSSKLRALTTRRRPRPSAFNVRLVS